MKKLSRGVTLIELLTALVILAILATIAIPSYRNYLIRAQRTDGTSALLRLMAAQEKFFLQNNQYATSITAAPAANGLGAMATSDKAFYNIALNTNGLTYTLLATPRPGGGQTDDVKCTSMGINEQGVRSANLVTTQTVVDTCWR